jgi:hypothetical protein
MSEILKVHSCGHIGAFWGLHPFLMVVIFGIPKKKAKKNPR